jgi:hypothetical protein
MKTRKKRILFNPKILLIIFFIGTWMFSGKWVFAKNLECYTQFGVCDEKLVEDATWLKNTPLLFPLPQKKLQSSYQKYSQIKKINLYRRLPFTLVIRIDLRKPIGQIGAEILGAHSVADSDGIIIGQQNNSLLPLLLLDKEFRFGEKLDDSQRLALSLLSEIGLMTDRKILGKMEDNHLIVYLSDVTQVIINPQSLSPDWKYTLHLILDRSKIQAKVPKNIDLRFSNPILKY